MPLELWDKQLYEERDKIDKVVGPYGSNTDQAMMKFAGVCDQENLRKIRDAWPEEWAKLLEFYELAEAKGLL